MSSSDIELWCFSFVTLFNLQGTRPAPLRSWLCRGTFTILPQVFRFVKYFFRLFSKFFRTGFTIEPFAWKLNYLTTAPSFCQALFSIFSKSFSQAPEPTAPLGDSSLNISDPPHFVNTFFHYFWNFFLEIPKTFSHIRDIVYVEQIPTTYSAYIIYAVRSRHADQTSIHIMS